MAAADSTVLQAAPPDAALEEPPEPPLRACNGGTHLCDRRFDQVTFATTHNAMASEAERWLGPNQRFGVPQQLEHGIRGLMLDVHYGDDGVTWLCHGECAFGSQPLSDGLAEIRRFMVTHPNEVVTLILESYISPSALADAFVEAGLVDWTYAHERATPWPTLGALIDQGTRLVVLSDVRADPMEHAAQLYVWDHAWETHWHAEAPADLSCQPNRGDPKNSLFILNHFLTYPIALPHLAERVNWNPSFADRVEACTRAGGQRPNFVAVDFYDIGDLFVVVGALNAP